MNSCVEGILTGDSHLPHNSKVRPILRYTSANATPTDKTAAVKDESEKNLEMSGCDSESEQHQDIKRKNQGKGKRRRQRKNLHQHNILVDEFDRNPNWDKE